MNPSDYYHFMFMNIYIDYVRNNEKTKESYCSFINIKNDSNACPERMYLFLSKD